MPLAVALARLARTAARLSAASDVLIFLDVGTSLQPVARAWSKTRHWRPRFAITDRADVIGKSFIERRTVHRRVAAAGTRRGTGASAVRTQLATPLLHERKAVGVLVARRAIVKPFTAGQIELLETFAAHAAVLVERARLEAAPAEPTDREHATAEIMKVISSSPDDTQPVFDTIVRNAVRLCGARYGAVHRFDGERLHLAAHHNLTPQMLAATGTAVGGVIRLGTSLSAGLQIDVVGTIDAVPSVTSANAVVVDLPSLDAYRLLQGDPLDPANGWWLSVDPAAHDQVRAALAGLAGFTISDRAQLTDRLLADPLGWGVLFALYVAVLGATVLAAFGLAVDARATSLRSARELAVLHTLGTPPRTLARALVVEQSVLAGLGVVAGLIAGVAVAAAMAPSLILTERGARPVPPVLLVMPPVQLVVPAVVLFGVALGLGAATARRARRDVAVGLLRIGADQ